MTRMTTPDVMGEVLTGTAQARRMAGSLLRMDGGTQPRDRISDELVMEYRDAMAEGAQFPPVVAFFDGSDYWLADGFHRVHAADAAGIEVLVDVRQGTRRDAVLFSAGANATHGQRRTNADKRRAVLALLHDDEWRQWSDREIARRCAVSNRFVGDVRDELSVNGSQMETRRVVRQGTEYDMAVPQRTAAPALASQGAKWASQVDLQLAIGDWLDAFDDPGAVLDELARDGQGSVLWEDVAGSMPVHREADLVVAIAAFRERMAATRKQIDKPAAMQPATQPAAPVVQPANDQPAISHGFINRADGVWSFSVWLRQTWTRCTPDEQRRTLIGAAAQLETWAAQLRDEAVL